MVGVAALGATMIIISGGIDLSVGSLIALVAVVVAMVINKNAAGPSNADGWDPNVAAAVGVGAGLAVAAVCGLAISSMVVGRIGRVAAIVALGLARAYRAQLRLGLAARNRGADRRRPRSPLGRGGSTAS